MTFHRLLLALILCLPGVLPAQSVIDLSDTLDDDVRVTTPSLSGAVFPEDPPPGPPLQEPDLQWIESTLAGMTLEEKVGQMLMPMTGTTSFNAGTVQGWIDNQKIGGIAYSGNGQSAANVISVSNQIQAMSSLPLLVAIDAEAGLGARVADATTFPLHMGIGSANNTDLTEEMGRITARECRALGVQIAFGPVVDVNTEPINPIISTRAYSDNPERVARMAQAFVRGARAEGLLTTFKHYPGHGATQGDSHSSLPTIDIAPEEIEAVHIAPYAQLASSEDVDLVMTAHVWYSQVDTGSPWPATLSSYFMTDVLRGEIGFEGVLISDAYTMSGLAVAVPDVAERVLVGVEAGLDIILSPPNTPTAHSAIVGAVNSGRISTARIDQSVRRILTLKSRAGIQSSATVGTEIASQTLRHPDHLATVRSVCEEGLAVLSNSLSGEPFIAPTDEVMVIDLTSSKRIFYRFASSWLKTDLTAGHPNTTIYPAAVTVTTGERDAILAAATTADKIIVIGRDWWWKINSTTQVNLINTLTAGDTPVIYVGFGSPYHHLQIPNVDAFLCGFSTVPEMQGVAAEVLLGTRTAVGDHPGLVFATGAVFE